jgi:hypothetical protein
MGKLAAIFASLALAIPIMVQLHNCELEKSLSRKIYFQEIP